MTFKMIASIAYPDTSAPGRPHAGRVPPRAAFTHFQLPIAPGTRQATLPIALCRTPAPSMSLTPPARSSWPPPGLLRPTTTIPGHGNVLRFFEKSNPQEP